MADREQAQRVKRMVAATNSNSRESLTIYYQQQLKRELAKEKN